MSSINNKQKQQTTNDTEKEQRAETMKQNKTNNTKSQHTLASASNKQKETTHDTIRQQKAANAIKNLFLIVTQSLRNNLAKESKTMI